MLFVLASDKTRNNKLTSGEKLLFIIPLILVILIGIALPVVKAMNNYEQQLNYEKLEREILERREIEENQRRIEVFEKEKALRIEREKSDSIRRKYTEQIMFKH